MPAETLNISVCADSSTDTQKNHCHELTTLSCSAHSMLFTLTMNEKKTTLPRKYFQKIYPVNCNL